MSVQAMTWAFEQQVEPHAKLVLLALANRANHETGLCYPGQERIGQECSMSARTVRRHLKSLEQQGLITRRARMLPEGRGRTSDEYRLAYYQPDNASARSGPTGQNGTTNRSKRDDQPDTVVRGTVSEPKEEPKDKKQRNTSMTETWEPDPTNLERIKAKHPTVNVAIELDNFRDYYISKGEKRADWNASLRTWIRNAEKFAKAKGQPEPTPGFPAGAGGVYS